MRIEDISEDMKDVLAMCESNQSVSLSEISKLPEIANAEERLTMYAEKLVERIEALTGIKYKKENIDTTKYPPEILVERREAALKKLENMRSAVIEPGKETVYNGIVERGGHLDIVIGLPASGKSSAIVDTLSQFYKARIIDNDEAKKLLSPEFNNGYGANLVHKESQLISEKQMQKCFSRQENVVIPKVGSEYDSIHSIIETAKEYGYKEINIHYVDLPREKAMGRLLRRFITDDRYLPPSLIDKYCNSIDGNKIQKTYDKFKNGGEINGYAKWNNDVKRGESPVLEECNGISEIGRIEAERSRLVCRGSDRGDGTNTNQVIQEGNRETANRPGRNEAVSADSGRVERGEGTRISESGVKKPSVLSALRSKQKIVEQYKAERADQDVLKTHQPKTNEFEK
ncbi:zeta toxin family protein [Butyrivibrio fibrisolvens]|uniref:zeta toxin family protein n=1 Tax=Butyrivibrio fibrisolvens TaxID=831 RepID=UPI0003B795D8|nr:zeta toxin family protein [Butyrivibrio fibrisolvens]